MYLVISALDKVNIDLEQEVYLSDLYNPKHINLTKH